MASSWLACALSVLCLAHGTAGSREIMTELTKGFAKAMEECKTELNLGDHIMQDFMNFWREEYELLNRDMGCAVVCMATKHDLITEDMKLHHDNAHEFAKTHGADDDLARRLVLMIHDCEERFPDIVDDCSKTLEISKCFRTKIHELQWAPSMETVLEELMTEA